MALPLPLVPPLLPVLPDDAPDPCVVAEGLLAWFAEHGRSFTWRESTDPFYVLVAEILLRKTGARAVEQYLPGFIATYPTPGALAAAGAEVIVASLAILGLSSQRGRQLHALARVLVDSFDGEIPRDVMALIRLPAVGAYTAGIVASTCFNARVPAVDANVARLLCRVFGVVPSHLEARKSPNVWQLAASLMQWSGERPVWLTWAELDFAAAICTARKPHHDTCPIERSCLYAGRAREVVVSSSLDQE